MPDDATESVATHSSRLQPSIICMLMFGCSDTQIYDPEVRNEGSGQLKCKSWDNNNYITLHTII